MLEAAVAACVPGGWLVMEFGYGQEDDVRRLVVGACSRRCASARVRADLQGIREPVIIRRR